MLCFPPTVASAIWRGIPKGEVREEGTFRHHGGVVLCVIMLMWVGLAFLCQDKPYRASSIRGNY